MHNGQTPVTVFRIFVHTSRATSHIPVGMVDFKRCRENMWAACQQT